MFFFSKKKRRELEEKKLKDIQSVRSDVLKKIDKTTTITRQANEQLHKALVKNGDVTRLIFLATGGDRRGRS